MTASDSPSAEQDRPKVLVLDDSAFVGEAAKAALEERGMDVRLVSSIARLNALLLAWSPTLVLLDVNMPGIEGTDVCKWLKARAETKAVPILLFSDMPEPELKRLVETCGADGCVSKRRGLQFVADHVSSLCEEIVF